MRCGTSNDIDAVSTDPSPANRTGPWVRSIRDRREWVGRVHCWRDEHAIDPAPVEIDHLEAETAANEGVANSGHAPELPQHEPGEGLVAARMSEIAAVQRPLEPVDLDPPIDQPRPSARCTASGLSSLSFAVSSPAIATKHVGGRDDALDGTVLVEDDDQGRGRLSEHLD